MCTALGALREPEKLPETHGLIEPNTYVDYDENDVPHAKKPSWDNLKRELVQAREKKSKQLRDLWSEVVRRRTDESWYDEHPLDNCPSGRFQDAVVQFQGQLLKDGYKFSGDGFEILELKPAPSVAQLADEALLKAFSQTSFLRAKASGTLSGQRWST